MKTLAIYASALAAVAVTLIGCGDNKTAETTPSDFFMKGSREEKKGFPHYRSKSGRNASFSKDLHPASTTHLGIALVRLQNLAAKVAAIASGCDYIAFRTVTGNWGELRACSKSLFEQRAAFRVAARCRIRFLIRLSCIRGASCLRLIGLRPRGQFGNKPFA